MMHLLLVLSMIGILTSTIYAALVVCGAVRFARERRRSDKTAFTPAVSLMKPLHGFEPGLEDRLESFFRQDYPHYEIVFCAHSERDVGLEIARRVSRRHPEIPVQFLQSGSAPYPNAKVWSLERMQRAASHKYFVVSDSDVSVTPSYLREVMAPFSDMRIGLATCLYRGVAENRPGKNWAEGFWAHLEAIGMSVEMSSGVLVADMLEGMKFALGPTMVVRRDCLEAAGGFGILGRYHADDFMLGNVIAERGYRVVLSGHTVDHYVLNDSFVPSAKHQIRWMRSTRFSRPKGHLGTALTFSMPYGLLGAICALTIHRPLLALLLLGVSWASRVAMAAVVGSVVVNEPRPLIQACLYPIRDFLGAVYWGASYFGNEVVWRGQEYRLLRHGLMRIESRRMETDPEAVLTT